MSSVELWAVGWLDAATGDVWAKTMSDLRCKRSVRQRDLAVAIVDEDRNDGHHRVDRVERKCLPVDGLAQRTVSDRRDSLIVLTAPDVPAERHEAALLRCSFGCRVETRADVDSFRSLMRVRRMRQRSEDCRSGRRRRVRSDLGEGSG